MLLSVASETCCGPPEIQTSIHADSEVECHAVPARCGSARGQLPPCAPETGVPIAACETDKGPIATPETRRHIAAETKSFGSTQERRRNPGMCRVHSRRRCCCKQQHGSGKCPA